MEKLPKYILITKAVSVYMNGQVAKVIERIGDDVQGYRLTVKMKNGMEVYPAECLCKEISKEEYNKTPYSGLVLNK